MAIIKVNIIHSIAILILTNLNLTLVCAGTTRGDVLLAMDIPAETLIMEAGAEVLTALTSSVTMDIGITGGDVDRYVDGDTNATGYSTLTATARVVVASDQ